VGCEKRGEWGRRLSVGEKRSRQSPLENPLLAAETWSIKNSKRGVRKEVDTKSPLVWGHMGTHRMGKKKLKGEEKV